MLTTGMLLDAARAVRPDADPGVVLTALQAAQAQTARAAVEAAWDAVADANLRPRRATAVVADADDDGDVDGKPGADLEAAANREDEAAAAGAMDWSWYRPAARDVCTVSFVPRGDDFVTNTDVTEGFSTGGIRPSRHAAHGDRFVTMDVEPSCRAELMDRQVRLPTAPVCAWRGVSPVIVGLEAVETMYRDVFGADGCASIARECHRHADALSATSCETFSNLAAPLFRALLSGRTLQPKSQHHQRLQIPVLGERLICIGPICCRSFDLCGCDSLSLACDDDANLSCVVRSASFEFDPVEFHLWPAGVTLASEELLLEACACALVDADRQPDWRRIGTPRSDHKACEAASDDNAIHGFILVKSKRAHISVTGDIAVASAQNVKSRVIVSHASASLPHFRARVELGDRPAATAVATLVLSAVRPWLRGLLEDQIAAALRGVHRM